MSSTVETVINTADFKNTIREICSHFEVKGTVNGYSTLKSGNINKTYAVYTVDEFGKNRSYLLQQINANVFSNPNTITHNIEQVTSYIFEKLGDEDDKKRLVERMFPTKDGEFLYIDKSGDYWRLMSYIYDSICVNLADAQILENTGVAFGRFLANLNDFPIELLEETIKDFHNTPKRVRDLKDAYEKDVMGRRAEVDEICRFIFSQTYYIDFFENAYKKGLIPKRVTHNDTKCNNVMFDSKTLEPLAVVDLDTVMPGFVAYDFGDAIRFGANTCAEDDPDIEKVELDLEKFDAFCRGYLGATKEYLNPYEIETLHIGVITVTLEICSRFVEDYLRGDVYFACRREKHNYYRSINQYALLRSAIAKSEEMQKIIQSYID